MFTVILKWDLRLVVLGMLPIIHTLFPLVALLVALFGSFFWTWCHVSTNIFEGSNPGRDLYKLKKMLSQYHMQHKDFVEVRCQPFDHPSGIPYGWDGTIYGIEIEKVLRWQRDFVICCFLIILEIPVCLVCTSMISAVKYIPCCIRAWKDYLQEHCNNSSCVAVLGLWPFHVLAILLVPVVVLLVMVILVMSSIALVVFGTPMTYFDYKGGIYDAFMVQFDAIHNHDNVVGEYCGWITLSDRDWHRYGSRGSNGRTPEQSVRDEHFRESSELYWDRFRSQCISTTAELLQKGWISPQDVQELEPAIIQSIPAVAILSILVDSMQDKTLKDGDIKWAIDGSVCKKVDRNLEDAITACLWPMVREIQKLLLTKKKKLLVEDNIEVLRAMLCANNENESEDLKRVIQGAGEEMLAVNNLVRTNINRLVLAILRVKPYQKRMDSIFSFNYLDSGDDEKV